MTLNKYFTVFSREAEFAGGNPLRVRIQRQGPSEKPWIFSLPREKNTAFLDGKKKISINYTTLGFTNLSLNGSKSPMISNENQSLQSSQRCYEFFPRIWNWMAPTWHTENHWHYINILQYSKHDYKPYFRRKVQRSYLTITMQ